MKLTIRDLVATVLVAAIAVPYVGYLMYGDMPFVQDARGMTGVGLVLGLVAFVVLRTGNAHDRFGAFEAWTATAVGVLGLVALALAEAASAPVLLAAFMAAILIVWAVEVADHAGLVHVHRAPAAHT